MIPAAAAVVYPFPSTLKVLELPPAFQHHATFVALFSFNRESEPSVIPSLLMDVILSEAVNVSVLLDDVYLVVPVIELIIWLS